MTTRHSSEAIKLGDDTLSENIDQLYLELENCKDGWVVSEEEYWKTYYDDPDYIYEWNNGVLEVRPMSDLKGSLLYQWFCDILRCWFRTFPIGTIINLDIGFRLALPHKTTIRIPDLSVVLHTNPIKIVGDDTRYSGIFDLCVESLSHSSPKYIKRDTIEKKNEYSGIGVKEYYILDARKLETAFYRLGKGGRYHQIDPIDDDVIESGILPGFRFRISDLYRQPPLEELAEDNIYHEYVFPAYKEMKQIAIKERERAERERERAEREKQRADQAEAQLMLQNKKMEKMAEKLRALGITING